VSSSAFEDLRQRLAEIQDLWKTAALLSWDQQVMMPSGGAAIRAEQLGTVSRIAHTKFISPEIGRVVDELRDFGEQHEYDSFEASLIRVTARDWEKASKVPADLRAEMSRSAALANPVWAAARRDNDFSSFLPVLRKNLDLRKRYIECFEAGDEPYDIVLDDYERGMKTAEVRRIFDYLKEHQAPLVKEVAAQAQVEKRAKTFDIDAQKIFELEVVREFGFTSDSWRLDPTVHPFASGTGVTDIRITTRYFTDGLEGLFGTMHEFGHGLYEHQVDPSLERAPLARGV
jgi:carboxypeptidase Taq